MGVSMVTDVEKRVEMFKKIQRDFTQQERTALLVATLEAVYHDDEQKIYEFLENQRKNYDAIDNREKA
jgi:hypothetical protein